MKKYALPLLFASGFLLREVPATTIDAHGYWIGEDAAGYHLFDRSLADAVAEFFVCEGAKNVVDFGCGMGDYMRVILDHQIPCEGYDGNPDTPRLTLGLGLVLDLSEPVDLGKRFDWVLSLEVGEHVPPEFETTFIENLDLHNTKGIVLSWAVKGQGGFGHYNCQDNEYIKELFAQYGYLNDPAAEEELRRRSTFFWFKNTLMVFRRVL